MVMSRESRKIFNELENQSKQAGVQGLIIPAHVYMCDYMVLKYFTAPVLNIIKKRIKLVKKPEWKHFTVPYWFDIIDSMLKNETGTMREGYNTNPMYAGSQCTESYTHFINNFLLIDYSVADTYLIRYIVNNFDNQQVINACNTAKQMNIYSPQYVSGILEKEIAIQHVHDYNMDKLNDKIESSNRLLNTEVHKHSPIELAMMEYEYNKKREDAKIEEMFNNLFGGTGL